MTGSGEQPLSGEVIWVTGASSGIGRQLTLQLVKAGARVIASARSRDKLETLAGEHDGIHPLAVDVTDDDAVEQVRQQLEAISPKLDRIVLCAGNCEYLDIAEPDWAMMRRVMDVNYFGIVNSVAAALPLLERAARPHIVGVASMVTLLPFGRAEAYGASKAAVQYLLDALRIDLSREGVDVSVINPGFVQTPLTDRNDFPMPFLMPAEVAAGRMLSAILKRRRQYAFPRRLQWSLRLLGLVPALWYRVLGPALVR